MNKLLTVKQGKHVARDATLGNETKQYVEFWYFDYKTSTFRGRGIVRILT